MLPLNSSGKTLTYTYTDELGNEIPNKDNIIVQNYREIEVTNDGNIGERFSVDNVEKDEMSIIKGIDYIFDLTDPDISTFPFGFSLEEDGDEYTTGIKYSLMF